MTLGSTTWGLGFQRGVAGLQVPELRLNSVRGSERTVRIQVATVAFCWVLTGRPVCLQIVWNMFDTCNIVQMNGLLPVCLVYIYIVENLHPSLPWSRD